MSLHFAQFDTQNYSQLCIFFFANVTEHTVKSIKNGRLRGTLMKNVVWKLFEQTGNTAYYLLYKELTKNGRNNKSHRPKNN